MKQIKKIKEVREAVLKAKEKIVNSILECINSNGGLLSIDYGACDKESKYDFIPVELHIEDGEVYLQYQSMQDVENFGSYFAPSSKIELYDLSICEIEYVIEMVARTNYLRNKKS